MYVSFPTVFVAIHVISIFFPDLCKSSRGTDNRLTIVFPKLSSIDGNSSDVDHGMIHFTAGGGFPSAMHVIFNSLVSSRISAVRCLDRITGLSMKNNTTTCRRLLLAINYEQYGREQENYT